MKKYRITVRQEPGKRPDVEVHGPAAGPGPDGLAPMHRPAAPRLELEDPDRPFADFFPGPDASPVRQALAAAVYLSDVAHHGPMSFADLDRLLEAVGARPVTMEARFVLPDKRWLTPDGRASFRLTDAGRHAYESRGED